MKSIFITLIQLCFLFSLNAQNLIGAWESYSSSSEGEPLKSVLILADGYQVLTIYNMATGEFVHTNGGSWKLDGNIITELVEFHTDDPGKIGSEFSFKVELTNNEIKIVDRAEVFKRIDDGTPGDLQGAWLMSGRVRDGKTQLRDTERPRKTMKILSGSRFQWVAYNTETKEFKGTGGGTYTTKDGIYTENIEFFSRDKTKTGLSLKFDYELINGDWHHKGLSSKGDPIHEIWSTRNK
ncbi:membrane or secreted protein [Winogradskyella alexanderae]|uniref:Membrane or secreted protein n=1 Tax=Winogradskyella alexanderae TaxID=2877123 RepID=A0ABS7XQ34_9FLAO|nr:membrane or secreted protein [Winogradskyella alexanderae]MCA0132115.1 membrane or secreted protein [Winogradskyella alexanderae]